MGQPARRIDNAGSARRAPRLALVEPARRTRSSDRPDRAKTRAQAARARMVFGVFVTALVAAVVLGGARVTLIARATEVAMGETRLQAEIKAERTVTDQLEVDKSSLSTPSRIAGIAASTMNMGAPVSVRYITLSKAPTAASGTAATSGPASNGIARVVAAVMDMSAGEAQSLLVGDLGLAGSR